MVDPSDLQVQQGDAFRINITVRGSPKPFLRMLINRFAATWHRVGVEKGIYNDRHELEVSGARKDESKRYHLGTAVQSVEGTEWMHNCIFHLNVIGRSDIRTRPILIVHLVPSLCLS